MSKINSYSKIYNIGHRAINDIFNEDVFITEKIDGSQFSFGIFEGVLIMKSKGCVLIPEAPEKMFIQAVETVREIQHLLVDGWTYRSEYLKSPKHNCLTYDRIPNKHIIIYDIDMGDQSYVTHEVMSIEANKLGLEVVPLLFYGKIDSAEELLILLKRKSILGDVDIEGVVAKNYSRFCQHDGKVLMAKHVSEAFKETNSKNWKNTNPSGKDFVAILADKYRSEARWEKAIQHLRDGGELKNDPSDIGLLIKEIQLDVKDECEDEIREAVFKWAWKVISRKTTAGFPEWYKEKLLKSSFEKSEDTNDS